MPDKSTEKRAIKTIPITRKARLVRLDMRMKYKRGEIVFLELCIKYLSISHLGANDHFTSGAG